jgi:C1A family cysteine protease
MPITLDELNSAIAAEGGNWHAGETQVSRYANLPLDDGNLFGLSLTDEQASHLLNEAHVLQTLSFHAVAPPPSEVDWRAYQGSNFVTPVKYQGTCGSCVAFATCASLEARVAILNLKPDPTLDLSEAHLFFCGCGQCCRTGWNFVSALNWAKQGIALEQDYRYLPKNQPCLKPQTLLAVEVPHWTAVTTPIARKQAIASDGPVIGGMNVYEDFYYYKGGVYRQTAGSFHGRHAVCVVGYNDSQSYWIIKNSWSSNWGENGYMKISYGDTKCGLDSTFAYYDPVVIPRDDLVV